MWSRRLRRPSRGKVRPSLDRSVGRGQGQWLGREKGHGPGTQAQICLHQSPSLPVMGPFAELGWFPQNRLYNFAEPAKDWSFSQGSPQIPPPCRVWVEQWCTVQGHCGLGLASSPALPSRPWIPENFVLSMAVGAKDCSGPVEGLKE